MHKILHVWYIKYMENKSNILVNFGLGQVEILGTTNLVKAKLAVHTASRYEFDSSYNLLSMKENSFINEASNSVIWYC